MYNFTMHIQDLSTLEMVIVGHVFHLISDMVVSCLFYRRKTAYICAEILNRIKCRFV